MNNKNYVFLKVFFVFIVFLIASPQNGSANYISYTYSVKVGDKIDYHLDILTNGTQNGTYSVYGLNLTAGDNFQMEIYKANANPITAVGADFTLRFDSGLENSSTFTGNFYLFTNNVTYWNSMKNENYNYAGQSWAFSHNNGLGTFAYSKDANNFAKVTFNFTDGLVISYEYKTSYQTGSTFTHIKFTKVGTVASSVSSKGLPSFELSNGLIALIFMAAIAYTLKRKKL